MSFRSLLTQKFIIKTLATLFTLYVLFWIPWIVVKIFTANIIYSSTDAIPRTDTAIVFGGLYYPNQEMTETNKERLLAAKLLYDNQKVDTIVVSNTEKAAIEMKEFLQKNGVPEDKINLDTGAVVTLDTCKNQEVTSTKIIFVSHDYHLPRILYQCKKESLEGIGFAAGDLNLINRSPVTPLKKAQIKFSRYQREALFTLTSFIGIY